jgi:hypothetical protein
MVVVAITAVFCTIVIVSGNAGQDQILVSLQISKLTQLILQAKELSIASYSVVPNGSPMICGYGVHINKANGTYSIFAFVPVPTTTSCPTVAATTAAGITAAEEQKYSDGSWNVALPTGVVFSPLTTMTDVLFYPPEPVTLISTDGSTFLSTSTSTFVYITTTKGSILKSLSVSTAGQVQD